MNHVQNFKAAQAYGQVAVQGRAEDASPHRIIQMLMESALQKIVLAKGHMQRKQITEKGEQIGWAISIIEGMRVSLDQEQGGEIATNLGALYEYMKLTLLEANLRNDVKRLDEVATLLAQVKSGWDALPAQLAQQDR